MDVIMPVWATDQETIELTEQAVLSLKAADRLIIIDNGSTIGGGQLRLWADLYIRNKENLGYARAVNQGLKLAGDIVAVANNDLRVSPNWKEVAEEILQDQRVGSVHFRMLPYAEAFTSGSDTWLSGKERWCTSSFFVMRNFLLFDETYMNSIEDWDYWLKMRLQYRYFTAYTNKAQYQHKDSHSQEKRPDRDANDIANRKHFEKKWGAQPEDVFERFYPGQLAQPWKPQP